MKMILWHDTGPNRFAKCHIFSSLFAHTLVMLDPPQPQQPVLLIQGLDSLQC